MKRIALIAAALVAAPAVAQDHSGHVTPAPSTATATTTTPATATKFSLDTPVETLMADEKAKAVLEANVPGIAAHPSYDMFKSMSFNQLAPMAPDRLTPEVLAKLGAGLAAIK